MVTGGAGFIGHHLVRELAVRGHEVVVVDDLSTGLRTRVAEFPSRVRFQEGDVRDAACLDTVVAGCDVVFHEAALPSVSRSFADPETTADVNAHGTLEVILAAGRAGVRRVVLASSSSVYGFAPGQPRHESQELDPRSPYAASKAAAEEHIRSLGPKLGLETVVLRYFNVFGPGQDQRSEYAAVVPRFITAALVGERPVVYGDGSQTRDFTHVDNVIAANLLAASAPDADGITANVGSGERHSVMELLSVVGECTGTHLEPVHAPLRTGDVLDSHADITIAHERLGYGVTVPFREGIRRTVEWYRTALGVTARR